MKTQQGATLIVSLIMLVILTLFVIAGISMSSVNLKIVGNVQSQKTLEANTQQAIEQVLSSNAAFSLTPAEQTVTVNGVDVTVHAPACLKAVPATGYSALGTAIPEDTGWEVSAEAADDDLSGAQAQIKQGVKIRLPPGNCPS